MIVKVDKEKKEFKPYTLRLEVENQFDHELLRKLVLGFETKYSASKELILLMNLIEAEIAKS